MHVSIGILNWFIYWIYLNWVNQLKLELCAFALKGEHNVYSLVPNIHVPDRISGHFRSIRSSFFLIFTKWLRSAILDVRNSLWITFQGISDRYRIVFRRPFWMSENHFGSHFWPFQIDRPFWMSEIHFRWHFWPFQIHTELYLFF